LQKLQDKLNQKNSYLHQYKQEEKKKQEEDEEKTRTNVMSV